MDETCMTCNGSGQIPTFEGETVLIEICPDCNGQKKEIIFDFTD